MLYFVVLDHIHHAKYTYRFILGVFDRKKSLKSTDLIDDTT